MYRAENSLLLLCGANETRKRIAYVYTQDQSVRYPFKGKVDILEPYVLASNGKVIHEIVFTPTDDGDYWHFSLSPCKPVDGAVVSSIVTLGSTQAVTVTKLASHAQLKRRNRLSQRIELLTFHKGREIISEDLEGKVPTTLTQESPCLSLPVPAPTIALTEYVATIIAASK